MVEIGQSKLMLTMAYIADSQNNLKGDASLVNKDAALIMNSLLQSSELPTNGQWVLDWGPVVVRFPNSKYSDNTMFVAKNKSDKNNIVIGIAGTTPKSFSDWIEEDFWVGKRVPWPFNNADGQAKISYGTSLGIHMLTNMIPEHGSVGSCQKITTYLSNKIKESDNNGLNITVTGHSLGGALAPTFGLWLKDTQENWDSIGNSKITVYGFAGATPGNGSFATYLNGKFSDKDSLYMINNSLDVIPHAWDYDHLIKIPDIYPKPYKMDLADDLLVKGASKLIEHLDYTPVGNLETQRHWITGDLYKNNPDTGKEIKGFFGQMITQHVNGYPHLLGVDNLNTVIKKCVEPYEKS